MCVRGFVVCVWWWGGLTHYTLRTCTRNPASWHFFFNFAAPYCHAAHSVLEGHVLDPSQCPTPHSMS